MITKWKFKCKKRDNYDKNNYNKGNYEWALKDINPKNITNIFELGAHAGVDTSILSKLYPDSTIIAVEALPELCDIIRKKKLPNVQIIQKAITDKNGKDIVFHRASKNLWAKWIYLWFHGRNRFS